MRDVWPSFETAREERALLRMRISKKGLAK
jgi:hypothetical protein